MAELFATGRIVDGILLLMFVEGAGLLYFRGRFPGVVPREVVATLGAGGALLCALRAALLHVAWPAIAAWLILALGAHGTDAGLRWLKIRREVLPRPYTGQRTPKD